jgi:hypothetical protein
MFSPGRGVEGIIGLIRQARSLVPKYPRYHRPIALLPHFRLNREQEGRYALCQSGKDFVGKDAYRSGDQEHPGSQAGR